MSRFCYIPKCMHEGYNTVKQKIIGSVCHVMVIIIVNGDGKPSSNPGWGCLHGKGMNPTNFALSMGK